MRQHLGCGVSHDGFVRRGFEKAVPVALDEGCEGGVARGEAADDPAAAARNACGIVAAMAHLGERRGAFERLRRGHCADERAALGRRDVDHGFDGILPLREPRARQGVVVSGR